MENALMQTGLFEYARTIRFNGSNYDPIRDNNRLTGQLKRVFDLMKDGQWYTLAEIAEKTGDPPASISAQLRHLRKKRFGSHVVNKQYIGDGLWEYNLLINSKEK